MKTKKIIAFLSLALMTLIFSGSYFIYDRNKKEAEQWGYIVRDFKSCDLTVALWKLGKKDLQDKVNHSSFKIYESGYETDKYSKLLVELNESKYKRKEGLTTIWLDPDVIDSLSSIKKSDKQISFFDQCDKLIKEGKYQIGLDLAYFYLYSNFVDVKKNLEDLAKSGVVDAYVLLGHAYRNGLINSIKDEKTAFENYLKASNEGSVKGMINVSEMFLSVDIDRSKKYVLAAAEKGSLVALYRLQDINGIYRSNKNFDKKLSLNDVKVLYYWNLIFTSILQFHNDVGSLALDFSRSSPFLREEDIGYEFDGIPLKPLDGKDKVVYYDKLQVESNKEKLESMLNTEERIQVQKRVSEMLKVFEENYKKEINKNKNYQEKTRNKEIKDSKVSV